jgi:hypothetical protein
VAQVHAYVLAVPASVAAGGAIDLSKYDRKTVYVDGTFVATIQIQISPDATGARWFNEGAPITTAGSTLEITKPCMRMRANTTAFTSGAPVATVDAVHALG